MMRLAAALVVLACAVVLVSPASILSAFIPDSVACTCSASTAPPSAPMALLPFVRRGDIAVVAMWVVLGVGVAPCFVGREVSAQPQMFADMAGVLMGAGPIYIARFRQVAQGDVRNHHRRLDEAEVRSVPEPIAGPISEPATS